MELQYNTGSHKEYTGNIAYQCWGTRISPNTSNFAYTYDKLNGLISGASDDNFKQRGITEDVMGNIKTLNRYQAGTLIDSSLYTYTGNYVLNLAPHQSNWIDGPKGVDNYSIDHVSDMLSGNDMGNTTAFTTNTGGYLNPGSHKNSTFTKEVGAFLKAWKSDKGDKKKVVSDFLDAMKKLGIKASVSENP